jgi:hypothetical protein
MEKYIADSIDALEYFSMQDAQAKQYSLVAKSLLSTCLDHLRQQELSERIAKSKMSSELFGLPISPYRPTHRTGLESLPAQTPIMNTESSAGVENLSTPNTFRTPEWEDFDIGALANLSNEASQDFFGTLNLFPMFANAEYDVSSF